MQNYFEATTPPFFSTDFHYFRIAPEKWELMLNRVTQMGIRLITITVPWGFHEADRGAIDLSGATNTRRNVAGLIELCAAFNLHCILKPGPYSHDCGILGNGLPHWLPTDTKNFNTNLLAATESWYKALSKALVKQQWPNGPIIALHLDDGSDAEAHPTYSQEVTEVRWPIWLRKRYQGIDALNQAYDAAYRNVSEVPFPQSWREAPTPLEKDAKEFLAEVQGEVQNSYIEILAGAGWQIPVYPAMLNSHPELPELQSQSLITVDQLTSPDPTNIILNWQHPIQVDPDPADIGSSPVWANGAPIRPDGSVRQKFWTIRQYLWLHNLPEVTLEDNLLTATFDTGGLVFSGHEVPLKVKLAKGAKPDAYRLSFTGELLAADNLKIARARLSGPYLTEDNITQTDLIFYLNDSTIPLSGFLLAYLRLLLKTQAQTLARCATQATALSQTLKPAQAKAPFQQKAKPTSYTLAEARRGLREADRVLRKVMASIGGLEAGFDTILGQGGQGIPEPAAPSLAISPEIFEGKAQEVLLDAGEICKTIAPQLKSTATSLQKTVDASQITLEQYRQSYAQAVGTAQHARESLLDIMAQLRIEIATEKLPLVVWRVHNQVQEIAESLRWGVLRGE